jgi:hypothetical protein
MRLTMALRVYVEESACILSTILAYDEAGIAEAVAIRSDEHSDSLWLTLRQIANHRRN